VANWTTPRQKDAIKILHELGMNDGDIAYVTTMSRLTVRRFRLLMKLKPHTTHTKWTNERRRVGQKKTFAEEVGDLGNYAAATNRGIAASLGWPHIALGVVWVLEVLRIQKSADTLMVLDGVNEIRRRCVPKRRPFSRATVVKKLVIARRLGMVETRQQNSARREPRLHVATDVLFDLHYHPGLLAKLRGG